MCGRYRLSRRKQIIEEYFDAADWQDDWSPRYNIAPTQPVPVIRQHPKEPIRQISTMRWGLIPHWSKDASSAASTINARSETAATKPAFRDPLKFRRCLIPADGMQNVAAISELLKPHDVRLMRCYPVSTRINHVVNDDEDCSRPVEPVQAQNSLFSQP